MAISGGVLTVLLAALLLHLVTAQSTDTFPGISNPSDGPLYTALTVSADPIPTVYVATTETTTTTTTTTTITITAPPLEKICEKDGYFPLFGKNSCISPSAYTGIFLTSIILAGLSFLMLLGLIILYCIRGSGGSNDVERSGYQSSTSKSIKTDTTAVQLVGATPLEKPRPRRPKNPSSTKLSSAADTTILPSAPYTSADPPVKRPVKRPRQPRVDASQGPDPTGVKPVRRPKASSPSGKTAADPAKPRRKKPNPGTTPQPASQL